MVEVTIGLVADHANVTREGKLNIFGTFDKIYAQSMPAQHPHMVLVWIFEADRAEANREHKLTIELIDEDGEKIFSVEGNMGFGSPPEGEYKVKGNQIFELNNLTFKKYGQHEFKILINGEVRKSIPIHITRPLQSAHA